MRAESRTVVVAIGLGLGAALGIARAQAQTPVIQTVALKSGETQDLGPVYYVRHCRSIAVGKPEVEILDGPPDLAVTIKEGEVVPRNQGCANKIRGGTLQITAPKEIEDPSFTRLVIRVTFKTRAEGDHKVSVVYNVSLIP
jgi:hypothetical protein